MTQRRPRVIVQAREAARLSPSYPIVPAGTTWDVSDRPDLGEFLRHLEPAAQQWRWGEMVFDVVTEPDDREATHSRVEAPARLDPPQAPEKTGVADVRDGEQQREHLRLVPPLTTP